MEKAIAATKNEIYYNDKLRYQTMHNLPLHDGAAKRSENLAAIAHRQAQNGSVIQNLDKVNRAPFAEDGHQDSKASLSRPSAASKSAYLRHAQLTAVKNGTGANTLKPVILGTIRS